jgi:hypothetical protein
MKMLEHRYYLDRAFQLQSLHDVRRDHRAIQDRPRGGGRHGEFRRQRRLPVQAGQEVIVMDDPACIELVRKFRDGKPERWTKDWGGA